tara:strand:- start:2882 stop:3835 length:954 start_codon:yes stop_codon:yes gene_type:complete
LFNFFQKKYSFVVIGPGKIAEKHSEKFISMGCKIVGVYSPREIKNNFFKGYRNITDLEDLKNLQFDFGIIASPNKFHKIQIEKLLELNKPIFVEKPVMISSNEFYEIKKKFSNNYHNIFGGFNLRYQDNTLFLKKLKLNQIKSIRAKWIKDFEPENKWSLNSNISGGGILIDWGIHAIDLISDLIEDEFEIKDCKFVNLDGDIEKSFIINLKSNSKIDINISMSWILNDQFSKNPLEIDFESMHKKLTWCKSGQIYLSEANNKSKLYNSNQSNIYDHFFQNYLKDFDLKKNIDQRLKNFNSYEMVTTLIEKLYKFKS